jgi:hypothetical protein
VRPAASLDGPSGPQAAGGASHACAAVKRWPRTSTSERRSAFVNDITKAVRYRQRIEETMGHKGSRKTQAGPSRESPACSWRGSSWVLRVLRCSGCRVLRVLKVLEVRSPRRPRPGAISGVVTGSRYKAGRRQRRGDRCRVVVDGDDGPHRTLHDRGGAGGRGDPRRAWRRASSSSKPGRADTQQRHDAGDGGARIVREFSWSACRSRPTKRRRRLAIDAASPRSSIAA